MCVYVCMCVYLGIHMYTFMRTFCGMNDDIRVMCVHTCMSFVFHVRMTACVYVLYIIHFVFYMSYSRQIV